MSTTPPEQKNVPPTTPLKSNNVASGDTPVIAKYVSSDPGYQTNQLDDARLAMFQDLGSNVPQITLDDFMKHLAPPQPVFDMGETMESLKSGTSPTLSASGRWNAFLTEPKAQRGHDDVVFKPLPAIYRAIVSAINGNSSKQPNADFLHNPNIAPSSFERKNTTKPDGYLLIRERSQKDEVAWADIVLPCEYKKHDSDNDVDDDVSKCLWSMQHIMRDDTCRRAAFGLTIENTTVRLWFCCRSEVIVSETFDFVSEPEALIRLFAAFAFANKEQLGFDPSIERVGTNDEFIFTVHTPDGKRKFKTKRAISTFAAEPLRGRGTRVFEAIEQDGKQGNESVALKDIWIDSNREREGAILAQILKAAEGKNKALVKDYFLTTICHGDVILSDGTKDDTETGLLRGLVIGSGLFLLQRAELHVKKETTATASGSPDIQSTGRHCAPRPDQRYPPKTHYRIVSKEVCRTLDPDPKDLSPMSFGNIMEHIAMTVRALELIHKLGWIHRDVSIGNILSYKGTAKLADLEYAKKMDSQSPGHELRTGTKDFMSIESAAMMYLFVPTDRERARAMFLASRHQGVFHRPKPSYKFSHNRMHDLESLWWVAVWILFHHHLSKPGDQLPDLKDISSQLVAAKTLFPRSINGIYRQNAFKYGFDNDWQKLPPNKHHTASLLSTLRDMLIVNYTDVEASLPVTNDVSWHEFDDEIYDQFIELVSHHQSDQTEIAECHLRALSEIETTLKAPRPKRSRAESTDDTGGDHLKKK